MHFFIYKTCQAKKGANENRIKFTVTGGNGS